MRLGGAFVVVAVCGIASHAAASDVTCICVLRPEMMSPSSEHPALVDAHVRVRMGAKHEGGSLVLRAYRGADVAVTTTLTTNTADDPVRLFDLRPLAPLAPSTRYEVGIRDPKRHPSLTVFATFVTASTPETDKAAPKLDQPGKLLAFPLPATPVDSCAERPKRLVLEGLAASDPGRPEATLLVAFWRGDASGRIDETKPPVAYGATAPSITITDRDQCGQAPFALPPRGPLSVGWAVVDESGRRSPLQRATVILP